MSGISRRLVIAGAAAAALGGGFARCALAQERLAGLEEKLGGKIGVVAMDTARSFHFGYRANERFAMCSTFKASLAAAVLRKVDQGAFSFDRRIAYSRQDLLPVSSVTQAHADEGGLNIESLCRAIIEVSDNTAANLLLRLIGGPPAMTAFFREIGDDVSRLDRTEPQIGANIPGDPRDTTTPQAMAGDLCTLLLQNHILSAASQTALINWMMNVQNGKDRIRAAVPAAWKIANKTGTSDNGAVNDIAVVWPAGRAPIAICVYTNAPGASLDQSAAAIRDAAAEVIQLLH